MKLDELCLLAFHSTIAVQIALGTVLHPAALEAAAIPALRPGVPSGIVILSIDLASFEQSVRIHLRAVVGYAVVVWIEEARIVASIRMIDGTAVHVNKVSV